MLKWITWHHSKIHWQPAWNQHKYDNYLNVSGKPRDIIRMCERTRTQLCGSPLVSDTESHFTWHSLDGKLLLFACVTFRQRRIYRYTVSSVKYGKELNVNTCIKWKMLRHRTQRVVSPVSYTLNSLRYCPADFARSSLQSNKRFNSCNTTAADGDLHYIDTATRSKGQL